MASLSCPTQCSGGLRRTVSTEKGEQIPFGHKRKFGIRTEYAARTVGANHGSQPNFCCSRCAHWRTTCTHMFRKWWLNFQFALGWPKT